MIKLENVTRLYQMGEETIRAADGISLHIKKGDFVALRGASGSGKSTIMNIIGCLDRQYSGQYFLNNQDVSRLSEDELAAVRNRVIGFVHQNFNLLPRLNALENVELPLIYAGLTKNQRIEKARKCLGLVGLSDREKHKPIQLSGGQQQRVAIARALVNDTALILADEPTGNLDSRSSVEIMSILQRLNERGVTVVLITHEADVAEWAGYSVYFHDGKIGS